VVIFIFRRKLILTSLLAKFVLHLPKEFCEPITEKIKKEFGGYVKSYYLYTINKTKIMDKKIVTEMINDVIGDKITQLLENLSTNEFVDELTDKLIESGVPIDSDDEEQREELNELIGNRVFPLLHKMSEYLIGKDIPKD